ncbi:P-loop containing nucleoside triphosphate hydrolase protein [Calocera cornea HHB12733]|uniref:p-loop containing nucleoside triphosphate hydrolase protein n=1 Tax=Calocera cornea HHB12733 TaxID=1353952 RepID=A0A165KBF0_9BASI|nr:P-loop containing nucleoside triphosphate hydrolase protein [Calocera cornea HHB12733]
MSLRSFLRAHPCSRLATPPRHRGPHRRCAHSGGDEPVDATLIRNIALLAHIDSGKTTLTESILHAAGHLASPGTVDTGSTTTDFLPAERERGITIQSASIPVRWKAWSFNLVDTPGHADFGMEVESASSVVDGAVVLIDAVEGVEGQTKGVWAQLDRNDVATRMIFLNKMDRVGASLRGSLLSLLEHRLHRLPLLISLPLASTSLAHYTQAEPGIAGLVDLVKLEAWWWAPSAPMESGNARREMLDPALLTEGAAHAAFEHDEHPLLEEILPARTRLIEALLDTPGAASERLTEELMNLSDTPSPVSPYLRLPAQSILPALRAATLANAVLPVMAGSAFRHVGTELLMDFVGELLASPVDVRSAEAGENQRQGQRQGQAGRGEVKLMAWKVGWDRMKGWMTFVRVYSGTLHRGAILWNTTTGEKERAGKLMLIYADAPVEVDSLPFGSIGVVLGLKHTRTGDTLVSNVKTKSPLRAITPPPSVISASVIPATRADALPLAEALASLARTDPSVRITEDEAEAQTLVHGLGALHLEIVEGRLRDEWGVACAFGRRRVSYREGFFALPEVAVEEYWARDAGAKKIGARVALTVRSLRESEGEKDDPRWGGNAVVHKKEPLKPAVHERSSLDPLFHVAQGLQTALSSSPHSSLPVIGLHITVDSCKLDWGSPPSVAASAAASALRKLLQAAQPGELREPFMAVTVHVNEEDVGKIVKDFGEKGGDLQQLGAGANPESEHAYPAEAVYVPPAILTPSAMPLLEQHGMTVRMKRTVHALVALSKLLDYNSRLRALSGGTASFEMTADGFRTVSPARRLEILREIGRA